MILCQLSSFFVKRHCLSLTTRAIEQTCEVRIRNCKLRIHFDRAPVAVFCLTGLYSTSLERYTQSIPGDRILWINLNRFARKELSICKPLCLITTRSWLTQNYAKSNVRICVGWSPRRRISIGSFSIVPSLLV